MFVWIWVIIPVVAIITSFILKFQKNQILMADNSKQINEDVIMLQEEVKKMQQRIENLEAIAAADPNEFNESFARQSDFKQEMEDEKEINQNTVRNIAQKRRAKS